MHSHKIFMRKVFALWRLLSFNSKSRVGWAMAVLCHSLSYSCDYFHWWGPQNFFWWTRQRHQWVHTAAAVSLQFDNIAALHHTGRHSIWKSQKKSHSTLQASQASYVYNLSGQKLIKNSKNGLFCQFFENLKLAVK